MATITLESVSKTFTGGVDAVRDLSIALPDGELLVLVGPSGCGKSTALRLIAGLEQPTAGRISIGARDVTHEPASRRDVAMVFQNGGVLPHLTVRDNIGFGLRLRRVKADERQERVEQAGDLLGIAALLDRRPSELSGGQRQRVAIGRAIVRRPAAFLMDEPLSSLDAHLRLAMRSEIARLQRDLGTTTVYVTHDQGEAMTLGDRVAVLNDGVLEQIGPPEELYDRPASVFVAGFIGAPRMNVFRDDARNVLVGVRPHDLRNDTGAPNQLAFETVVDAVERLGNETLVYFTLRNETGIATFDRALRPAAGDRVRLAFHPDRMLLFDPETGGRIDRT